MAETVEDLEETLSGIRKALQAVTARSEPSPSAGAAPLQRPAAPAAVAAQRRSPPPPPAALAALAGETPHQRPEPAPTSVQDGHGGFSAAAAIAARMGLAGSAVALVGEPPMAEAPLDIVHAQRQLASKPIVEGGHVFYQRMPTARGTPPQMAEIERRRDADRAPQRDELERDIARLRDDLIACGSELDQKAPMKVDVSPALNTQAFHPSPLCRPAPARPPQLTTLRQAIRSEREELAKDIERLRQEKAELESEILETERLNAQSKQTAAADMLRNDFSHAAWGSTNTSSQRTAGLVPAASGGKMQEPTSGPNLDTMSAPISVGRPDVGNVLQLPPEYKDYHLHAPSVQSRHEREQELRRPLGIRANRAVPHASQPQVASGLARKNTAPAWANGMSLAEWEALQQQAPQVHSQLDSGAGEQDNLLRAQPHWESARQMSPPAPAPPPPPQMLQQAQQVQQPQPRQQQPSHHHQNYEQDVTQKQPMDQHQKHEQDMVLQQQEFLQHLQHLQHLQSMQGQMRPSEMDIRQQAQTMVGTEGADPQSYGNLHQQPGEPMVVLEVVRSVQHESPTSLKAPVLLQRPKRESDHTHPSVGVTEAPPLLTDPTLEGLQQSPQARQQFPDASTVLGMDPEEYEQQSPEKYGKLWQLVPDGPSSDRNPNIKRYRETDGADEGVYSDYGYSDYHVPIQDGPLNGDDRSTPLASSTSRSFTGDLGLPITCEVIFAEEHKDSHDPDLDAKMGALQHGVHGYVSLPKDITAGYVRTGHTSKELSPEDDRVASMNQLRMEEAALQNQQQPLMQQVTAHTIPGSMRRSIGRLPSLERVDEVVEEDGEDVEEEDSQEHVVNQGRAEEPDPALFQQNLSNSPVDQLIEQYAVSPFSSPTKESALALPMRDGPSPPSHSPGQPMHTRSEGEHGLSEGKGDSLVERSSSGFVHRESRDELRGSPDFGPEASASVRESVCDVDVSMYGSSERNVPKSVRPNFSSSRGELQKPQQKEDSCVDSGDISGGEQHHVKARRLQQEPTPGMVEVSALYSKPEEPSPSQDESLRLQSPLAFPTVEDVRPPETEASPPSHLQPLMPSPLFLPENEGAQDYTAFFAAELSVTKGGGKLLDGDVVPPALPFGLHEESDDGEEPVRPLLEAPPPQPMTMPSTKGKLSSEGNISPVPKLPLDTLVPSKQALTVLIQNHRTRADGTILKQELSVADENRKHSYLRMHGRVHVQICSRLL